MLSHISALTDGLMWTRSGTVWAVWRVSPIPYAYQPDDKKHAARRHHTALYRALRGESLHLGLVAATDPVSVVEAMVDGVDVAEHEAWAAECNATLDFLEHIEIGRRVHWIAAPLPNPGAKAVLEPLQASWSALKDQLMLPRAVPSKHAIGERAAQAELLRKEMPSAFDPRPASVAEMAWMFGHAMQRGLGLDTDVPVHGSLDAELHLTGSSVLPGALIDPAGQTDASKRLTPMQILKRPYVKVIDPENPARASYQSTLVVSDTPSGGIVYPGCEWIGRVDESSVPCDWAIRMTVRSREEVTGRNRRAVRTLNDQFDQRSEEERAGSSLDSTARALGEYQAVMDADELEVEVDATTMFTVSAPDPEQVLDDARDLTKYFAAMQFKLRNDPTVQAALFDATLPGMPTPRAVREYSQITTARSFAAAVPFATTDLGDNSGSLFALEISNGASRPNPVFVNLGGASDKLDVALAMGFVGELGAGKALALDTPIPTPSGWTTMGELAPGDRVLDENGTPTDVVGVSPVMQNRTCYEVEFSDGSTIVADADHLWTTVPRTARDRQARLNGRRRQAGDPTVELSDVTPGPSGPGWFEHGTVATTEQLRYSLVAGKQLNHAIPVAAALDLPPADLPVHPYYLGLWLGNGNSSRSHVTTADPEALSIVEMCGYEVTKLKGEHDYAVALPHETDDAFVPEERACLHCGSVYTARYEQRRYCGKACAAVGQRAGIAPLAPLPCARCGTTMATTSTGRRCEACRRASSLTGRLGALGVLRNKHIPAVYLRAGTVQRRSLLAGLMDSAGAVSAQGAVEFTDTNARLARDVLELALTLGHRAVLGAGRARLSGRDTGPKWTVAFTTTDDVFTLRRKAETQLERTASADAARDPYRYVKEIRRVASVPVRCIRVASESHLFLAGESMIPTHNSVSMKSVAMDNVDRGATLMAVDHTDMGEWGIAVSEIPGSQVVEIAEDAQRSLDPLRILPSAQAPRITRSFLTVLLSVQTKSEQNVLLSKVLQPGYMARHGVTSLGSLARHLETECELPGARLLADEMRIFSELDFGRAVFDDGVPPVDLTAPAIVLHTHKMQLPSKADLEHGHLFAELKAEKVFGRAAFALIAALARYRCFADRTRLDIFAADEAAKTMSSPEAAEEIGMFIRDGRKHKAALLLGSHDAEEDFGNEVVRGLIPFRVLLRHRDENLARRGLRWLHGLPSDSPVDPQLVKLITEGTAPVMDAAVGVPEERRGECLVRDFQARYGRAKVMAPLVENRAETVKTTPTSSTGTVVRS
ncbi:ATP-binding protein [Myceligenerans pegani]|uniref:ATP-binding protein n=1 Tax=Myceligenerans pegani TaxID=2776917 RepID=A0ABR9N1K1_9MICO|nr:ATP-binding protein [Myceligenerans sp. TRM 65318]MBE1877531.1 ATP-binding protein [Myceligenerans sp. TRM 65318]MBE3019802.1 ATP-binding protein [Myceligenerans sp. TRM 65318]